MKTTTEHTPRNEDLTLAFAELERLERDRAGFAAAKLATRERLGEVERELDTLRERLYAERPRAWARVRREQVEARRMRDHAAAKALADVEAKHAERLTKLHAELEARRLHLAELEAMPEEVERPTHRMLRWSVPAAASALVAVFAFTLFGAEHTAEAHRSEAQVLHVHELEIEPEYPDMVAPYAAEEAAPAKAEVEAEPEPEKKKKKTKKKTKAKAKDAKTNKKPIAKERANKLILTGGDNPLG